MVFRIFHVLRVTTVCSLGIWSFSDTIAENMQNHNERDKKGDCWDILANWVWIEEADLNGKKHTAEGVHRRWQEVFAKLGSTSQALGWTRIHYVYVLSQAR